MTSGPEHYERAEELLEGRPATAAEMLNGGGPAGGRWTPGTSDIARAKVHAGMEPHEHHAWAKVASTSTEVES
jgi:hypothetical protein